MCGLRFSVAITVFKMSGFKVFKCYLIFQKLLNLIRLQPKTNQLCRPVPEMNPEKNEPNLWRNEGETEKRRILPIYSI